MRRVLSALLALAVFFACQPLSAGCRAPAEPRRSRGDRGRRRQAAEQHHGASAERRQRPSCRRHAHQRQGRIQVHRPSRRQLRGRDRRAQRHAPRHQPADRAGGGRHACDRSHGVHERSRGGGRRRWRRQPAARPARSGGAAVRRWRGCRWCGARAAQQVRARLARRGRRRRRARRAPLVRPRARPQPVVRSFATTAGIVTAVAVGAGVTAAVVATTNNASPPADSLPEPARRGHALPLVSSVLVRPSACL